MVVASHGAILNLHHYYIRLIIPHKFNVITVHGKIYQNIKRKGNSTEDANVKSWLLEPKCNPTSSFLTSQQVGLIIVMQKELKIIYLRIPPLFPYLFLGELPITVFL